MSTVLLNDVRILVNESFRHRNKMIAAFVFIGFSFLAIGLVWPNYYQSEVTIQVNERNIITPLMEGSAVPTSIADTSRNADELIHSRKVMNNILESMGWISKDTTNIQREQLIEKVKKNTTVDSIGHNLIKITYKDRNAERAMKTAQRFGELFLAESRLKKNDESEAAFEFIDKQVKQYHAKLLDAERKLKEFRSEHLDARPGTDSEVAARLTRLQRQLEQSTLEYKEEKIKKESIERQLSGEAETNVGISREGQYQTRIAQLQIELDTLRLSYHETYPDIIRLRHQIEDLKDSIIKEKRRRKQAKEEAKAGGAPYIEENVVLNPLYQELRRTLFSTKTRMATLSIRTEETKRLLVEEIKRGRKIHVGEAALAELTRDYEVNRDIYQDLLRRRERARVSKNLDQEEQGVKLSIYEPAYLPVKPSGLRFMHFMMAGIVLGVSIPIGLLYVLQQVDPRIRSIDVIKEKLNLPVLAVLPILTTPVEKIERNKNIRNLGMIIIVTICLYLMIGVLRISGII